jgi:hypothetical protein
MDVTGTGTSIPVGRTGTTTDTNVPVERIVAIITTNFCGYPKQQTLLPVRTV